MHNIQYLIDMRNKLYEEYNYYLKCGFDSQKLQDEINEISDKIHYIVHMSPMAPVPDYIGRNRVTKEELVRQDRQRKLNRICDDEI